MSPRRIRRRPTSAEWRPKRKVKTVVLYHLLPGPRAPGGLDYAITNFTDGVRAAGFAGEVIVSQDLMVL